ncbi:MAG: alpha/beta hydrolase [Anaeromyxobacter sp.]
MVLAGQYLERPALIPAGDATLEGLYHRGAQLPALLVIPPPGPGGGMDEAAVAELAWAAARAGHPSLRFQLRGVGASTGSPAPERALEDAEAAHEHLAQTAGGRIALAAVGGGWRLAFALSRAHPEIDRVVLLAPDVIPDQAPATALALLPERGGPPADAVAAALGARGRVELIEGADPALLAGLPAAGRKAVAFLASRR